MAIRTFIYDLGGTYELRFAQDTVTGAITGTFYNTNGPVTMGPFPLDTIKQTAQNIFEFCNSSYILKLKSLS